MALVIDIASYNGRPKIFPTKQNVEVLFLTKRSTSRVHPLDAGISAIIKRRYTR